MNHADRKKPTTGCAVIDMYPFHKGLSKQ